jgi:two-component system sensor histidine kinase YesM
VLTIYRKIYDNISYRTGGALVIDLLLDQILDITDNVRLGQNGIISIADSDGGYLYHPDRLKWGAPIPESYKERIGSSSQVHFVSDESGEKKIVIAFRSEFTGLTLISEVPLRELIDKLVFMRNLTIVLGTAMLLFAVVMIAGFSWSITKPLSLLMKLMKKVELGNLQIRAPERQDEIGRLNQGFNRMLNEIQRLIEIVHYSEMREKEMAIKQRESLLQSLQLRINPHFLYNTLEVINAYAIVAKVKPISQMTVWLSQILRYSISHPDKIVLLSEEMNNLFTYFSIQKERFRDLRIEALLEPEWLEQVRILPLTIQPLVENAFMHAYEKQKLKPDYFGLFGIAEDEWFTLRIVDHGRGMAQELAQAYNEAFEQVTEHEMLKPDFQLFPRLGLWNVHSRLRLAFGCPYGLTIVKSDESGTVMEIKLPYVSKVSGR